MRFEDLAVGSLDIAERWDAGRRSHYLVGSWPDCMVISLEAMGIAQLRGQLVHKGGGLVRFQLANGDAQYRIDPRSDMSHLKQLIKVSAMIDRTVELPPIC